jgi:hypothetical protein
MNTRRSFVFVGWSILWLSFANDGHSELIQTINVRLVARVTTQTSTNGDTRMERMKSVRVTTKDILNMLGTATGDDFGGATLVCVHRGEAYQVRHGTNVLADVTDSFVDESASDDVIDQDFNSTTGKDNYHGFWLRALTFDDQNGNHFTLSGMIEERYTAKAADSEGMQQVSDVETLNGTGNGTLTTVNADQEGQFALFSGAIVLSGKGVVPLNSF